jgi:hypothetical protein
MHQHHPKDWVWNGIKGGKRKKDGQLKYSLSLLPSCHGVSCCVVLHSPHHDGLSETMSQNESLLPLKYLGQVFHHRDEKAK